MAETNTRAEDHFYVYLSSYSILVNGEKKIKNIPSRQRLLLINDVYGGGGGAGFCKCFFS